jgi:hypothetical protein
MNIKSYIVSDTLLIASFPSYDISNIDILLPNISLINKDKVSVILYCHPQLK